MRKVLYTSLATLMLFAVALINACKPDPCKHVNCAYSGVCKEGACVCQIGYEGEHCETITRDKFKGLWNVNEDGTLSGAAQYSISIENGDKINEVRIKNFQNNFLVDVIAVAYKDTLTIPFQTFGDGTKVEGWATITDVSQLNQHYYQHAVMQVYYKVTNSLGITNEYGTGGSGASLWSK